MLDLAPAGAWQERLWAERRTHSYHADTAIKMDYMDEMSQDDMARVGDNPDRPKAGSDNSRALREKLLTFVTEAEKIKGDVYGEKATEGRWNKWLVMSDDNVVIEVGPDGSMVDITAAKTMACTTGFNAEEALAAVSHTCVLCSEQKIGISSVILMDVTAEGHRHWCRQCYSKSCKDDPRDARAWRKKDGEETDTELPKNSGRRTGATTRTARTSR